MHKHAARGIIDLQESAATHGLAIIDDPMAEQALVGGDGGPSSPYELDHDPEIVWLEAYQYEFVEGKAHTCALDIAIERKPQVLIPNNHLFLKAHRPSYQPYDNFISHVYSLVKS